MTVHRNLNCFVLFCCLLTEIFSHTLQCSWADAQLNEGCWKSNKNKFDIFIYTNKRAKLYSISMFFFFYKNRSEKVIGVYTVYCIGCLAAKVQYVGYMKIVKLWKSSKSYNILGFYNFKANNSKQKLSILLQKMSLNVSS